MMSNVIQMNKEELVDFIIVYCTATHIGSDDKRSMIKETLDQNNTVTVTLPSGGEILQQSTQYEITWSDNLDENVKIELYQNSLYNSDIISSTSSDGSYFWDVPDSSESRVHPTGHFPAHGCQKADTGRSVPG